MSTGAGVYDEEDEAWRRHHALIDEVMGKGHIKTPLVAAAFRAVPRHFFLPQTPLEEVYTDDAIPTKFRDETPISSSSQPSIMAIMLEQLQLEPGHRVLEIGAGTGYNAALMAHIVGPRGEVISLDIDDDTVAAARRHLASLGVEGVRVIATDGAFGFPPAAPYDRVILTVAAADIAPAWPAQLRLGGRLVLPLDIKGSQLSIAFEHGGDALNSISAVGCGFMMLRGSLGDLDRTWISLGPDPGLSIRCDNQRRPLHDAVYESLRGPSHGWTIGVSLTPSEVWNGLDLWLALHDPAYCRLAASREPAARAVIPTLYSSAVGLPHRMTIGLQEGISLALLSRSDDPGGWEGNVDPRMLPAFSLVIQSFGHDPDLARRLVAHIMAWDAAGRPSADQMRVSVYPAGKPVAPPPGGVLLKRRWSWFVLDMHG